MDLNTTNGPSRELKRRKCACGCRDTFPLTRVSRRYVNDAHRYRGYQRRKERRMRAKIRREVRREMLAKSAH